MPIKNPELKKIIDALSEDDEELIIKLPLDNIIIDDDDVTELCHVISAHKNLLEVSFQRASIYPFAAREVFATFINHPHLIDLYMPVYEVVISPGQKALMTLQEEFTEILNFHNSRKEDDVTTQEYGPRKFRKIARKSAPPGIDKKKRYTP